MTKKIYKIVALLVCIISVQACKDDFLNLDVKNYQSSSNYYKTEADALAATNSCYDPIKGRGLFGENFQYFFYPADDRILFETPYMDQMLYNATNGNIGGNSINFALWDAAYRGVFRTNMALEKIPAIEFKSENGEATKNRYLAEAHFMRALYYFYLEIMFNRPPLILKVLTDPNETVGNATPEEIWAQIEEDLKFAISMLPDKYDDSNVGRATKGAANALLGKAYLYQQKWDMAKQYLGAVITSGNYGLVQAKAQNKEDYIAAFQCNFTPTDLKVGANTYRAENNIESVFEVQNSDNTETGYPNGEWSPGNGSDGSLLSAYFSCIIGYKNVTPTAEAAGAFEAAPSGFPGQLAKDPRFYASVYTTNDTLSKDPTSKFYNIKWNPAYNPPTGQGYGLKKYYWPVHESVPAAPFFDPNNWRLIRYSDVLLMYAEAIYHLGEDPYPYINQVRARVGMPEVDAGTTTMPEALIHERDVEFFAECLRYHDLVRWSLLKDGPWVNPETLPYLQGYYQKGKNEYLPIPQSEIDAMRGNLTQNAGW